MKEPYRTLWFYLIAEKGHPEGSWHYNVKWTGSAFYIGTNEEHITITENVPGFHHTYPNKPSNAVQQRNITEISTIIEHIEMNTQTGSGEARSPYREPSILKVLKYLQPKL